MFDPADTLDLVCAEPISPCSPSCDHKVVPFNCTPDLFREIKIPHTECVSLKLRTYVAPPPPPPPLRLPKEPETSFYLISALCDSTVVLHVATGCFIYTPQNRPTVFIYF